MKHIACLRKTWKVARSIWLARVGARPVLKKLALNKMCGTPAKKNCIAVFFPAHIKTINTDKHDQKLVRNKYVT